MTRAPEHPTAVVVGGGFAGVGCAKELARHGVQVTLIDRNNYHQFQPLLYQVATAELGPSDIATPLRTMFRKDARIHVKQAEATSVDPANRTVATADGHSYSGDFLVLAVGSRPNFFGTPGAAEHAFPLYSLLDADRLRSRVFAIFEDADRDPRLVDQGALNFVVVGAGATGVEIAGALADLVSHVLPGEYRDLPVGLTRIHLVELGDAVLPPFSPQARRYAARVLERGGVQLRLGVSVKEVAAGHVVLSDGSRIPTRCAVWAGGLKAEALIGAGELGQGRGGRVDVLPDLTIDGFPRVYALGDAANIAGRDGSALPQLGSVALQSGRRAARNIVADLHGRRRLAFHYRDKGIMAMIGRGAAVAELGPRRRELQGVVAFAAWLGVHAWLLSGVRARIDAFVSWGWDYFSGNRAPGLIDRSGAGTIDWSQDGGGERPERLAGAASGSERT